VRPPDRGGNSVRGTTSADRSRAAPSGPPPLDLAELVERVDRERPPPDLGRNSARAAAEFDLFRAIARASDAVRERLKRRGREGPS
jgi:hypothetical protein